MSKTKEKVINQYIEKDQVAFEFENYSLIDAFKVFWCVLTGVRLVVKAKVNFNK